MPFQIIRNDITKVRADAIVNTANPDPIYASGTDSAVYHAAGADALLAERKKIGSIAPGEAAVTPAFALPARYIIHTVGPVWMGGGNGEFGTLASCYRKSLLLARQLGCKSIAFPLISTGVYGFPKDKALTVALDTIADFLADSDMDVTLVVFDRRAYELSASLVRDVSQFIDENYVAEKRAEEYSFGRNEELRRRRDAVQGVREEEAPAFREEAPQNFRWDESSAFREEAPKDFRLEEASVFREDEAQDVPEDADLYLPSYEPDFASVPLPQSSASMPSFAPKASLSDVMSHMGESFQEMLLRLIDERGLTDSQVYRRANVDRKLFSKIRCNADYTPKKRTAVALAVALELSLDETVDLLRRAGMALSPSSKFDLIVEYCIENHIYNIFDINALLFEYDQQLLGC